MCSETFNGFLLDFRFRFRSHFPNHSFRDFVQLVVFCSPSSLAENPDRHASITSGVIRYEFQSLTGYDVVVESPADTVLEDSDQFVVVVVAEVDASGVSESAVDPVIDFCEDAFFVIGDEDHCQVRDTVEVVQQGFVFELVNFIEDNDVRWTVVVAESVEKQVFRCRLTVYIDCLVDAVEQRVQGFEAAVVLPAVNVLMVEVHDVFAEAFDGELCDTGFPDTGRSVEECRVS